MENLTHSLSKKSYSGNGFGMASHKSVYDDVFGGPPKFGVPTLAPRFEDYAEIFGGFHSSRGSSIPILDLPVVEEVELAFDVRSSRLDYSEVFGGFDGLDFAISFENLVSKSNGGDDSSDDAWSPAHSESVSDESDPSVCSERSQSLLNVDADLFDNVRQFNVSYHKVNQKTDGKLSNRAAHVAQVCAIPVHSYVVNETHASPIREEERPPLQPSGDLNSKSEFIGRTKQGRCFKKSISLPTNNGFRAPESDSHHVESSGPAFTKKKPFVTVNDISLRTRPSRLPPPSRPPPVFAARKGGPGRPISELRAANSYAFERVVDEGSPPFYDVQIDASSSKEAPVATEIAMEKAQEKIGSAKESMEKKEVPQSCLKVHAQDSNQIVEKMINKAYSGAATCMDDMVQEMLKRDGSGMQPIAKVSPAVIQVSEEEESDLIDREKYIDLVEKSIHRRQNKESSPQVSHKPIGTFAWRQETEYFEVIETDIPFKAVEQYKDDKSNVLQDIGSEEYTHATVASTEASQPHEFIKEVEVEAPKLEETRSLLETRKNTREWSDNRGRSNKTMETRFQKENQNNAEVDFKSCESEMGKKRLKKVKQHVDKKIEQDADKCAGNVAKAEHHVAEVEVKGKPNATNERTDSCKVILDVHAKKANERRSRECIMMEGCDKKLEDAVEKVEDVKGEVQQEEREHQEESSKKGEKEKNRKQVNQGKENQNKLKEAIQQEGYAKRFHMSIQHEENKTSFRTSEQEDKDRHQNPDYEMEGTKQRVQETHSSVDEGRQYHKACEIGELDVRLTDIWKQEPSKNGSTVAFEEEVTKENSRLTSVSEGSQDMSKNTMKHEKLRKHTEDANPIKWDGDGRMGNQEQGIDGPREGLHINSLDGACKLKDNTHQTLTAAQAPISCEEDKKPGTKDGDQEVGARTSELQGEEISFSLGKNKHDLQHEEYKIHLEDDTKLPCSHDHVIDSNPAGTGIGNSANKQDKEVSQVASDPEKKRVNTHEKGHKGKVTNRVQMSFSEEITKENSTTYQVFTELTGDGKNIGAALPSMLNDRKNLNTHQRGTNQNAETKERHPNVTLAPEDRKIEERLDQERELEKEHLRRMEEEKEREREREKDRMAVDRAALEARERSYSEARERAERAAIGRTTAEVRQRVAMEARGRLDKEAMEARIRAERAAVERATAEARQRAFEKAMAEKASFETRERVERSVSDKLYASSRNAEMRPSSDPLDLQTQSSGASNVSHYSYTSAYAGTEGESPQRSKARLERYRRTAERAAKALAEKNMRDLLAQREQAEKSRLAETLDAEVRRWSSGKEGNLRALLSTLQYILGPDSGWQPIPLTEVITSAAVKKAYRKATLCVHPDKLQQRGANIQQKYICEKVFDLLKEAWNTFNSEER